MPFPENTEREDRGNAILVSVSKRYFKHAVDRNRVKRQIREAYRNNKSILEGLPESIHHLYIAFLWTDSRLHSSKEVGERVKNLLLRIVEAYNKSESHEKR